MVLGRWGIGHLHTVRCPACPDPLIWTRLPSALEGREWEAEGRVKGVLQRFVRLQRGPRLSSNVPPASLLGNREKARETLRDGDRRSMTGAPQRGRNDP